ncbi:MAG: Na/Pi cotransporter family protein [Burkholderiales bacterium]
MTHLLNLLAAIALLVWGTQIVRSGMLRVFGEKLREVLAASTRNRFAAAGAGMGVTCLVQSSTATGLIVASFVDHALIATAPALAVMLGADVGSALMTVVFSFDLSWLSPLLIFGGVVVFTLRESTTAGRLGRIAIGLGLITLALQLIVSATKPLTASPEVQALLLAMPNDLLLEIVVGMLLTVMAYSGLAIVLLIATLAASGLLPMPVALGLVLGANLGSGLLALIATANSSATARRVPLGNLLFRLLGITAIIPLMPFIKVWRETLPVPLHAQVVGFHLLFNIALAIIFIGLTPFIARIVERWLREPQAPPTERPNHLDPVALDTPSLAISCAAREALHQADIVETMLRGMLTVIRSGDLSLAQQLRALDDTVDALYGSIKIYLTKISRGSLSEREGSRWTDIISFVINMEQIADIIERVIQEVEDKNIRRGRRFSDAGMAEVTDLHGRLMANLRLAMSVFLDGHVRDAQKLLQEKADFRDLEHEYANAHLARLSENTMQSVETSALHIDLISELKRINSLICAVAYPILEQAGALTPTRLKQGMRFEESRVRSATQPAPLED